MRWLSPHIRRATPPAPICAGPVSTRFHTERSLSADGASVVQPPGSRQGSSDKHRGDHRRQHCDREPMFGVDTEPRAYHAIDLASHRLQPSSHWPRRCRAAHRLDVVRWVCAVYSRRVGPRGVRASRRRSRARDRMECARIRAEPLHVAAWALRSCGWRYRRQPAGRVSRRVRRGMGARIVSVRVQPGRMARARRGTWRGRSGLGFPMVPGMATPAPAADSSGSVADRIGRGDA